MLQADGEGIREQLWAGWEVSLIISLNNHIDAVVRSSLDESGKPGQQVKLLRPN